MDALYQVYSKKEEDTLKGYSYTKNKSTPYFFFFSPRQEEYTKMVSLSLTFYFFSASLYPFLLGRELSKLIPPDEQGEDCDEENPQGDLEAEEKAVLVEAVATAAVQLRRG